MAIAISGQNKKVRIEAPGCPDVIIEDALIDAVQDFFRMSEAWRYTVPTLLDWTTALTFPALTEGVEIPADTRVFRLDVLKYASDGTSLKPVPFSTRQQLDCEYPDWEVRTGNSPQRWTNDAGGNEPRIIPIADADVNGSIQARVILVPLTTATTVEDFFYHEYHDAFRFGALARILKMPGRDWTNPQMAAFYRTQFDIEWKKAKSRAEAEYGQPVNRVMAYGGI